jgi:dihydroflavonol-4-reductase
MKIFLTGGSGFIGSAVVRKLLERGDSVRCLLRPTSSLSRIEGLPFERVVGDVRDAAAVAEAIRGCDAVIHLACLSSWQQINSADMDAVAVEGTRNVMEAAIGNGCRRAVYVSSILAIGASRTPCVMREDSTGDVALGALRYSMAKRRAEEYCREAVRRGLDVVIVNPGEVYGPHDDAMVTAGNLLDFAKSWPVLVCKGGTAVAHVDDVAGGILAALERGRAGERYILASENLSVRSLAGLTLQILGLRRPILNFPTWMVRSLAWLGTNLRMPLPFEPAVIPYATLYWFMDGAKAKSELGIAFRPARETLASTLSWLRTSGRLK